MEFYRIPTNERPSVSVRFLEVMHTTLALLCCPLREAHPLLGAMFDEILVLLRENGPGLTLLKGYKCLLAHDSYSEYAQETKEGKDAKDGKEPRVIASAVASRGFVCDSSMQCNCIYNFQFPMFGCAWNSVDWPSFCFFSRSSHALLTVAILSFCLMHVIVCV